MAKPTFNPAAQPGTVLPDVPIPIHWEHHSQNTLLQYPRHPPSTWGPNEQYWGPHHHPPSTSDWQGSPVTPVAWLNYPQTAVPGQYNSTDKSLIRIPPVFGPSAAVQPTSSNRQMYHDTTAPHSNSPTSLPVALTHYSSTLPAHLASQCREVSQRPSSTGDNLDVQRLSSYYEYHYSIPQSSGVQKVPGLSDDVSPEQVSESFQSIGEGADQIEALLSEELNRMHTAYEELLRELRKQLFQERGEKEVLQKRVHELEAERLYRLQLLQQVAPNGTVNTK